MVAVKFTGINCKILVVANTVYYILASSIFSSVDEPIQNAYCHTINIVCCLLLTFWFQNVTVTVDLLLDCL